MRLIDEDTEIEYEIERYKEKIQQWNDNKTDRKLYDVDLKIRELERNILDCKNEIKCLKQYETVGVEKHDKKTRDKVIEEFASLLSNKGNIIRYDIDEILSKSGDFDYACDCFRKYIDEIAKHMKRGSEE